MFDTVKVNEWMTADVMTARPSMPISEAHKIMDDNHIRRLPVVDNTGKLVGLVTLGDVREASPSDATTLSIWELNYLWAQLTVDKVMTRNVITVAADTLIIDAAELLLEHKIGGLPVVDNANHVVGVITESDIFRMLVKNRTTLVK